MTTRLDHANLTVRDVEGVTRFLAHAFPGFRVRGRGRDCAGLSWVHVGDDATYLSLLTASGSPADPFVAYGGAPGLNHLGFEVDDVDAIRGRLRAAGYRESSVAYDHPHRRRAYFYDDEGNEWEFVQFLSDRAEHRNAYAPGEGAR
jgi:catechol 2,3-dioxygenase-like lactoylglutathione lyase family enzyme